jgi:cell wall assembly regulator SMI1
MTWRELITSIYETRSRQPWIAGKPEFYPGASAGEIDAAEARLNARLPVSHRELLLESNGVMDMMSIDVGEWFASMWLLWTAAEIVERNLWYRAATENGTYERDFRSLVFFADAGSDGILFGFPVMEARVCSPRVMVWHPIMDELDGLAPSLEDFLKGWLTSTISV